VQGGKVKPAYGNNGVVEIFNGNGIDSGQLVNFLAKLCDEFSKRGRTNIYSHFKSMNMIID
jgi:hypothetical protein